jgi:5-methylcytosine-specific restriction endonuclease McrA
MKLVLLLNGSYEPLTIVDWQRAITLVFSGKAEIIEEYPEEIRSQKMKMKVPAVIRLYHQARIRHRLSAKFTRANLFTRDSYTCQYCDQKFDAKDLTFDHVIPITMGGRKTWDNIVTACEPCNSLKEGRTPEQAGMHLMKKPKQPAWAQVISITAGVKHTPEHWRGYLFAH